MLASMSPGDRRSNPARNSTHAGLHEHLHQPMNITENRNTLNCITYFAPVSVSLRNPGIWIPADCSRLFLGTHRPTTTAAGSGRQIVIGYSYQE